VLKVSAVTAAAMAWAPLPLARAADEVVSPTADRKRAVRFAHLTDIHVQPERGAAEGLGACLRHAQGLKDAPAFILTGGDGVMDVFDAGAERAKVQADLWRRVWRAENSLPVEHCIGNHDVWGWGNKGKGTAGDEPGWGKQWALDLYGLSRRYRSFDKAGWHFVVLDSVFPNPADKDSPYKARLDDEQFDWLERDLSAVAPATPVLVLTHIPILCVCAFFDGDNAKTGDWIVPGAWMHIDAKRIRTLFDKHPNVKLCLSGHEHLWDRVQYNGVTYVCNGAVCGNWWKGSYHETPEGYGVVDLYADGTFEVQYVRYGWKVVNVAE
jgi:3',5'-cyclic AMP phosphodiesterase CpdA